MRGTEREREREQERVTAGERERGRSAMLRIDGCDHIFYKGLDITGKVLTQFFNYADVCRRTNYMQVNEGKLIHYLIQRYVIFGIPHG